jgi:hypothetical protein
MLKHIPLQYINVDYIDDAVKMKKLRLVDVYSTVMIDVDNVHHPVK